MLVLLELGVSESKRQTHRQAKIILFYHVIEGEALKHAILLSVLNHNIYYFSSKLEELMHKLPLYLLFSLFLSTAGQSQDEFISLWHGSFAGWTIENAGEGDFTLVDGLLHVEGGSGWLRSENQYDDFIIRSEFRWLSQDADSGIYIRAPGDADFFNGWPGNTYQIQIRNPQGESRFPPVGGLFRHGTPAGTELLNEAAVEQAYLGTNAWHTIEIEVNGDTLTIRLNDIEIGSADNILNSPGYIGIQSELGIIEYRTIELQALNATQATQ